MAFAVATKCKRVACPYCVSSPSLFFVLAREGDWLTATGSNGLLPAGVWLCALSVRCIQHAVAPSFAPLLATPPFPLPRCALPLLKHRDPYSISTTYKTVVNGGLQRTQAMGASACACCDLSCPLGRAGNRRRHANWSPPSKRSRLRRPFVIGHQSLLNSLSFSDGGKIGRATAPCCAKDGRRRASWWSTSRGL